MSNTIKILALMMVLTAFAAAQAVTEKTPSEKEETLQKEAVAFLRETLADVNSMRSLENRISFTAEIASLMWFHDEREARQMYSAVIGDFRDLLLRYDAQMNALGPTSDDANGLPGPMSFMIEPTEKGRIMRRFSTAMGVRQQIAMSIAEHDPEVAFSFYTDSLTAISNVEFRKQLEGRDSHFETQLFTRIAETNPGKAAQFASISLKNGFTHSHLELLKKIHAKNPERGAEFGAAILSKVKSGRNDTGADIYLIAALLDYGGEAFEASRKPKGKRPVYGMPELKEIAEILAQRILNMKEGELSTPIPYIETIQKYSPDRALQIRTKFRKTIVANAEAEPIYRGNVPVLSTGTGYSNSNSNANSAARYEQQRLEREEQEKAEQKLLDDVQGLGKKQLPKEDREKIIAQARKIIAMTPGRDKKVTALTLLATQVAKLGDKELAAEIMRDAERLVNPAPKNYQDFILMWMLASGYASTDPAKAFPLLEETIGRANDTLAAFVKVGEFIDVAEEMIQDGEVQVGAFGGQMVRGLTRELGMADATIQVLARADFAKTKNLTNGFERPEIRVLAKMMVLRAILKSKDKKGEEQIDGIPVTESMEN